MKTCILFSTYFMLFVACNSSIEELEAVDLDQGVVVELVASDGLEVSVDSSFVNDKVKCLPRYEAVLASYSMNDVTSGRMNRLDFTCQQYDEFDKYGFVSLIGRNRERGLWSTIEAKVYVSFNKKTWGYTDESQQLEAILVIKNSFELIDEMPFRIGDFADNIDLYTIDTLILEDVWILKYGQCRVALKVDEGMITRFLVWEVRCDNYGYPNDFSSIVSMLNMRMPI